jgi:uncharacterized membrane protein HdeD (DUF308 family)
MQTLIKSWWLLALCGVLDAIISVINFDHAGNGFHSKATITYMGMLALAAGACTITAGMWSSRKRISWLLVLNGLALGALGLILTFLTGPLAFRTIALLIFVMAMSIGIYELATAGTLRRQRHVADEWLLGAAGVVSVGFALWFLAFVFRWIKLEPASPSLLWLGSYFGFSAICMLGLGLRYAPPLRSISR